MAGTKSTGRRVLIVEDDGIISARLESMLLQLGYDVLGVTICGEDTLQQVSQTSPDLVLMDIHLGGEMNGIEAAAQVQAQFDIPVVYLTAFSDDTLLQQAKITGPYGYLVKPVRDGDLRAAIEMALYKHEMETKLKENERWLDTTLRSIGDAVIATDEKGYVTFMNPVAEALTGWGQAEAVGEELVKVFHILNEETVTGLENHTLLNKRDGTAVPIAHSTAPIRDHNENVIGVVLIFRDITEQVKAEKALKQAHDELEVRVEKRTAELSEVNDKLREEIAERMRTEAALRESEQRYKLLLDSVTDYIYTVQIDGGQSVATSHNPACVAITGYTSQEYETDPYLWYQMIHAEDREAVTEQVARILLGEASPPLEHRIIHKDGSIRWIRHTSVLRKDEQGTVVAYDGLISDVTGRKEAEQALQESEEKYRALVESSPDIIFVYDRDGRCLYINYAGARFFGKSPADIVGRELTELFPKREAKEMLEGILGVFRENTVTQMEHTVPFGQEFYHFSTTLAPIHDDGGAVISVMGMARDVTEHKQAEETLHRQAERLEILHQMDQAILTAQSLEGIIDGTLRHLRRLITCQRTSVALFDLDRGEALFLAVHFNGDTRLSAGQRISFSVINHFYALQQGDLRLVEDLATLPDLSSFDKQLLAEGIHSYLMIPLVYRGQSIGSLNFGANDPNAFSPEHIEISREVADQLAVAIQNARLYEETQQQSEELAALSAVSQAVSASLNLPEILTLITEHSIKLLDVAATSVALYDETREDLWFAVVSGGNVNFMQGQRLALEQGIAGWVARHGEPLLVPDAQQDPRFFTGFDRESGFTTHSMLCVPLRVKGRVIGVIEAINKQDGPFNQKDLNLLCSLATPAAVAIENARLYEQAQQEIAERRQAQESLRRAYDEIEMKVRARTAELAQSNNNLKEEIAERKRAEALLQHMAWHDMLTGLPNRALFMSHLEQIIAQAKQDKDYLFAVLFLDLDRFKFINDSLGHLVGDRLLIVVARRLEKCVRPCDMVARLGGDEFVILLDGIRNVNQARNVANCIQGELTVPVELNGYHIFTTASIGIITSTRKYERPEDILRDADTAMYQAKAGGKGRYELFDTDQRARAIARLRLETDLWRALERQEFLLYYQPVVSLDNGQITGVETLLRWQHPRQGLISPEEFVPLTEETGLIVPIGEWVIRTACAQIMAWHEAGYAFLRLAINVSAHQFQQQNLLGLIQAVLQETGLTAHTLELEITESITLQDNSHSLTALNELRTMGVHISIDDFGLGSSLNNLKFLPLDTLKIDQSFVRGIMVDGSHRDRRDDMAIVTAIITMAHSLGLKVIAEGVETEEQAAFLRAQKCNEIQGYLVSQPVPAEALTKLLQTRQSLIPEILDKALEH